MIPRFLEIAAELDGAQRNMREMGYSQADIEDEMERIRARHAQAGPATAYSDVARQAKAHQIVVTIWRGLDDGARHDARTGWLLREAGEGFRHQFAKMAGYPQGCSELTWKAVVTEICELVTAERRGQPEPCGAVWQDDGPCVGGNVGPEEVGCSACMGTGFKPCENCGEAPGTVVTPLGLYCAPCAPEAAY